MNKFATQDMRQHLMLNKFRLSTAGEVAQEIEDYWDAYWDATEEYSRDDKNQAALRKVENLMGCHTILERVMARRAKEKYTKDSDFNPSVVNSESLVDIVANRP